MTPKARKIGSVALTLLFWLGVWLLLARTVDQALLVPEPLAVFRRLLELAGTAEFWKITFTTIGRVLLGILSAGALGVLLAVLTTSSRLLDTLLSPLMTVVKSTPVASFVILALIWIERDVLPVFIAGLMVLPVVWANVSTGIRETDAQLLELARVYRMPRGRVLRRVYVPSVMPHFCAACRTALGFGWKAGIAAEVLTVPQASIGRMIFESKLYLETTDLFAWTLAVILLSLLIERILMRLIARIGAQTPGGARHG